MTPEIHPLSDQIWNWAYSRTVQRIEAISKPQTMRERKLLLKLEYEAQLYQRKLNHE